MLTNQERPSPSLETPLLQRARILYILGALLTVIGLLLFLYWLMVLDKTSSDFAQDYAAASRLMAGGSIYDGQPENYHPPFNAILFIPLALLGYSQAVRLWTVMSLLMYLGVGLCITRLLNISWSSAGWIVAAGIALCWYPFQAHLALGQVSLLLITCLIGGWALIRRGREYEAGLLFALAILVKLFPGLVLLYLLLRWKIRAIVGTAAGLVVGWLSVLLVVGWDDTWRYFQERAPEAAARFQPFPINISITSIPARFFSAGPWIEPITAVPEFVPHMTIILSLIVLAILAYQLWHLPPTVRGDDTAFAIVCLAMLLLSPISWQHVFPLLALPLGLLLAQALQTSGGERHRLLIPLFVIFVLLSLPDIQLANHLMALHVPYRMPWYAGLLFTLPTVAICALWHMLWQSRRTE
jgi:alpha-1,2-mannosyltransferase